MEPVRPFTSNYIIHRGLRVVLVFINYSKCMRKRGEEGGGTDRQELENEKNDCSTLYRFLAGRDMSDSI